MLIGRKPLAESAEDVDGRMDASRIELSSRIVIILYFLSDLSYCPFPVSHLIVRLASILFAHQHRNSAADLIALHPVPQARLRFRSALFDAAPA
jgi:hypothetical protein